MLLHFIQKNFKVLLLSCFAFLIPVSVFAEPLFNLPDLPIKYEFIFFALTLISVAIFHHQTMKVALTGLFVIVMYKLLCTDFEMIHHIGHEWKILLNLFGLLMGFAILARHFEDSGVPQELPRFLPNDWKGGFVLLVLVFIISSFLDNIAAAIIGGAVALIVYKHKVHIGYIAAIVAASNAGGSGSVVGDTTTTMMWIDGVPAAEVLHAYIAAIPALIIFGVFASIQQDKYQRIQKEAPKKNKIDGGRVFIVLLILAGAILANVYLDMPALGVWLAIMVGTTFRETPWKELPPALKGSIFLLALVFSASMMPVEELPPASLLSAFSLGFISAVFDNIPLTKLALTQGGYDWGVLAYSVGFGGSMLWFGSSAGVAITNIFPEARDVGGWIKNGWHIILAYIISFGILASLWGWHPLPPHKADPNAPTIIKEATH